MKHLSLLLLTEDSGTDAPEVLRELVTKMLWLVAPLCDVRRVRFEPATDKARAAMNFNGWNSRKAHYRQIELAGAIIRKLLRTDDESFVLIHIDGDLPWCDSQCGKAGLVVKQFHELLLPRIQAGLAHMAKPDRIERLLLIIPYYSIEAWLFQNTRELLSIYQADFSPGHADLKRIDKWRTDSGAIEDETKPKELLAIGSRHNLRLAREQFPAQRARDAGKSFALAVHRIEDCAPLNQVLSSLSYHQDSHGMSVSTIDKSSS